MNDQNSIIDNYVNEIEILISSSINSSNDTQNYLNNVASHPIDLSPRTTPSESQNVDQERVEEICKDLKNSSGWNQTIESWKNSPNSSNDGETLPSLSIFLPVTRTSVYADLHTPSTTLAIENIIEDKQIKLLHPLERFFRPRYKSDYFPQHGLSRRPRYVADQRGSHFLTLQIPKCYQHNLQTTYIRVASITVENDDRKQYYSPYKFQQDHDDWKLPDVNPLYIPIRENLHDQSMIKLQLVLIKAKSDHLADFRPLKLFSDTTIETESIDLVNEDKLSPKDFITKYQLTKSQLAFTICQMEEDRSYKAHPESTCISSIITEIPTTRINTKTKTTSSCSSSSTETTQIAAKEVCCPNCSHSFPTLKRSKSSLNSVDEGQSITNFVTHQCDAQATTTNQHPTKKKRKT